MKMASREKKSLRKDNLPNLKICVDNTDELSKSSSESSEEEGEISEDDRPLCVEAKIREKPKPFEPKQPKINRKMASPVPSDDEEALTVDLDDLETFGVTKEKKKYENKEAGKFELGFDPTSKESLEKREERAKRFGIKSTKIVPLAEGSIEKLYESLGINQQTRGERGIRLDAIHLRGCDDMSTEDVFSYFRLYAPANIEWIDDSSCNIVWPDKKSAARAMWFMSDDPNVTEEHVEKNTDKENEKEKAENNDDEEKMEESDPDELDLLSSDDEDESNKRKNRTKIVEKEKVEEAQCQEKMDTGDEGKEPTEDEFKEKDDEKMERLIRAKRILPPGRWRVGLPLPKNQYLFMRFATKADRKLPGAERRSRYYQRYGNPNYGGTRGLISNSRKQRIRNERYRAVEEEARKVISQHYAESRGKREQEFFKNRRLRAWSSDEEEAGTYEEDPEWRDDRRGYDEPEIIHNPRVHARLQDIEIKRRRNDDDSDREGEELDMEAELGELLRQIPEKRKMRMYADDEEELIKRKRMHVAETTENPDLRSRIGSQGHSLSSSRQARRRRHNRYEHSHYRDRSSSPEIRKSHKYEKITIQVDPDDV